MPLDLALDLAHALDPVAFVQDRLKFEPDPWQARLLRSRARPGSCSIAAGNPANRPRRQHSRSTPRFTIRV